jgi:hypothetical protein
MLQVDMSADDPRGSAWAAARVAMQGLVALAVAVEYLAVAVE